MNLYSDPLRVVIYARVSTEHEAQLSALDNQVDWYDKILLEHPEWDLIEKYIDEGITGTSVNKRPQFLRMIEDAKHKKFDLIITREVSRFARNTVDTLQYTRMLKKYGVEVYFISDNIKTFEGDGELRLTIMATLAQEESRKMSLRVRAGVKTSMEKGVVWGNGSILGYDKVGKELVVNKEQAKVVRRIFDQYLRGKGYCEIARTLEEDGILTATGKKHWHHNVIKQILDNSIYCGIMTYHKEYVRDYLEQKKIKNYGEIPRICVRGNHEPIISEEEFESVQKIRASRRYSDEGPHEKHLKGGRKQSKTTIGALLECECGASMNRTTWSNYKDRVASGYYCYNRSQKNKKYSQDMPVCSVKTVSERFVTVMANYIFTDFMRDKAVRRDILSKAAYKTVSLNYDYHEREKQERIKEELLVCQKEKKRLLKLLQEQRISPGAFSTSDSEINYKISQLETDLLNLTSRQSPITPEISKSTIKELDAELKQIVKEYKGTDVPDSVLFRFVERIVVHPDSFDWYLCVNDYPYLFYRKQYNEKQFSSIDRTLIHTAVLSKPDAFQYFYPTEKEPKYIWKDLKLNIWI